MNKMSLFASVGTALLVTAATGCASTTTVKPADTTATTTDAAKTGEGHCGGDKGAHEGSCGADKKAGEGSCGEGSCGAAKPQ